MPGVPEGAAVLLEAFEVIAASRPDVVLVVAGRSGHATDDLEARRDRSPFRDRIRFLGARDDVPELLAAADVFVSSSLYEGMPGAVLEAFALAVPVVATDIGGTREVATDGGSALFAPPADALRLAEAMGRVLDDPALGAALGARGREAFAARFTLDASIRRMIDLYERELASLRRTDHP